MKVFAFVEEPYEEAIGMDPVQDGRRTLKTLGKINVSMPVAHAPMVSPLARDLVLHGFRKPWKTIGNNVSRHWKPWEPLREAIRIETVELVPEFPRIAIEGGASGTFRNFQDWIPNVPIGNREGNSKLRNTILRNCGIRYRGGPPELVPQFLF